MDDSEAYRLFDALWADVLDEEQVFIRRPFLAHYTSLLGPIGLRGRSGSAFPEELAAVT